MFKSFKIKLNLNNKQRSACAGHAGVTRHAYNYFVNYCKHEFENGNKIPSAIDMHKILVKDVKQQNKWYYGYSKYSPQQALRNLETSYKNFHRLQKKSNYQKFKYKTVNGNKTIIGLEGLPQYKKKGINDSFYLEGNFTVNGNKIKVPKIGWLTCFEEIPVLSKIKNVTISRKADQWFISFKQETTIIKTIKRYDDVGVDLGVKTLATLSNGITFKNNKPYIKNKKKLRKAQKELSRRHIITAKSQSNNYMKTKLKVAKLHLKISNIRQDTTHKITSYLSKNYESVAVEDLKIKNMVKNHHLASAISDGGFFEFKRQLIYKKEWYGGNVIIANTYYPSSKLCNNCKSKNNSLKLEDRVWTCPACGIVNYRDLNASKNLNDLNSMAVSSTVTAFGDKSSVGKSIQLVDELGIKHQMFSFV